MKSLAMTVGIILILLGVVSLAYQGFTYTSKEQVAQIGSLQVTADTQKTVYLSPLLGGISVLAGIVLVVVGRKK
jgi:hypothetical protein